MAILFYISNELSTDLVNRYSQFVIEVHEHSKKECLIICEVETMYEKLTKLLFSIDKIHVFNIYNLYNEVNIKNTNANINQNNYLYQIDSNKLIKHDGVNIFCLKIQKVFKILINKFNIIMVNLNFNYGVLKSSIAIKLFDECKNNNISFNMIFNTPLKGRFMLYDSIYFESEVFNKNYSYLLNNELSNDEITRLTKYFEISLQYHQNYHAKNNALKSKKWKTKDKIIEKYYLFINKKYNNSVLKQVKIQNNYLLILLTKPNHWYTKYANPEIADRFNIIKNIWLSTPVGYKLILKAHPRISREFDLEKQIANLPGCYLAYNNYSTADLCKHAKIIFSFGSTSILIPLMLNKHVVDIGNSSSYFNFINPPLKRVKHIQNIKEVVRKCLAENPPTSKIYKYFYCLINNSYPINSNNEFVMENDNDYYDRYFKIFCQKLKSLDLV